MEPIIGYLKAEHRMDRCHLQGAEGASAHAVLRAVGYNLRWLRRTIAKKGCLSCGPFFCAHCAHGYGCKVGCAADRGLGEPQPPECYRGGWALDTKRKFSKIE
jgi:hypothetical protein